MSGAWAMILFGGDQKRVKETGTPYHKCCCVLLAELLGSGMLCLPLYILPAFTGLKLEVGTLRVR